MLEQQIVNTKQENNVVGVYFAKLKTLWDENKRGEEILHAVSYGIA